MAANSTNHASSNTKCHSAFLRRLLCSRSLPTHPSDQFVESNIAKSGDQKAAKSPKPEENMKQGMNSNPGVVARLMGLDSFPNTPTPQKDGTLGSFFRSKSVNSIDFLPHFDPIRQHRRVRTSVSFREGIYYYHDRITSVVSDLEKVGESREDEVKRNKKEKMGRSENSEKLREKKIIYKKPSEEVEVEEQRRSVGVKLPSPVRNLHGRRREGMRGRRAVVKKVNYKEEIMPSKCSKKGQNENLGHYKVHSACKIYPEGIVTEIGGGEQHSRQDPPSHQISYSQSPCSNTEMKAVVLKGEKRKEIEYYYNNDSCYYKRMVEMICGLTEESVSENWAYDVVLKFDDSEEMGRRFGQEILEALLKQFVHELMQPTLWD